MRIYVNRVIDWVIAESEGDANEALMEHYGNTRSELDRRQMLVTGVWPDEKPLRIADGSSPAEAKLPAEWIASEGRGFLCSTER